MTFLIFDKREDSPEDIWTTERLKEESFICLSNVKEKLYNEEGRSVTVRKYYAQARYKIYLIPVAQPAPSFVICFSDLSSRIQEAFTEFCRNNNERNVMLFLKDVAGKFFENLDYAYYHGSVMKCLRVRLVS
jgi:hypothetical protein